MTDAPQPPVFVLVEPQLLENIGASARALQNCSFPPATLRLVNPREHWGEIPPAQAVSTASGAMEILESVEVFETLEEAISDLTYVWATTARRREVEKPLCLPEEAIEQICGRAGSLGRSGILFGPERSGLRSEDIAFAHGLIEIPLNPSFSSLNLSQAVLLLAYGWWRQHKNLPLPARPQISPPAPGHELTKFFHHLEEALEGSGFLYPPHIRPNMLQNIKNLFLRAQPTSQEVQTWRGILTSFQKGPRNRYIHQEVK